jgi:hypothetical protein
MVKASWMHIAGVEELRSPTFLPACQRWPAIE